MLMRFGCCLNMLSKRPDGTGAEHLDTLKAAGYDYVELPLAEMCAMPDRDIQSLREKLELMGLSCEACNNFFPKTLRLTGSNADPACAAEYTARALELAASLGAKRVVFGSGPAKNVPNGFPIEKGYEQVVRLLQTAAPIAAEKEITIAIEPLRRAECNLINTFAEGCRLAADVSHRNVKVLVDYYHFTVEQEPLNNLREFGAKWLTHVHFAEPDGRVYPTADAAGRYLAFFRTLKEIGYDGRVSIEAYSGDYRAQAKMSLQLMRAVAACAATNRE